MQISLMFLYLIFGRYYLYRSLFHSAIFHLHAFLIILLAFAGWQFSKRDANYTFQGTIKYQFTSSSDARERGKP